MSDGIDISAISDNGFSFGANSTWDFNAHVEKYPAIKGPLRRRETIIVPGRTGALHLDEGAYDNYIQPYEIYFHDTLNEESAPALAHKIKEWLLTPSGYQRLMDVYDPDHYRLALCTGPLDMVNQLNRYGRVTVEFDCCGKSYLVSGEQPLTLTAAATIQNPTGCPALPMITVYGTEPGELYVGGTTIGILSITDEITIDCETMNAYRQVGDVLENMNGNISAAVFPTLPAGGSTISWSGGITSVNIIPRWWTL